MADTAALERLIEAVEAGTLHDQPHGGMPMLTQFHRAPSSRPFAIPGFSDGKAMDAYRGSLDAAKALHEAVLPGWGWRVGACHLSDDAFVFPDYNCPVHGERMKRDFDQRPDGSEWSDLTDIDQRPAGNVARAWLRSILTALLLIEQSKGAKP